MAKVIKLDEAESEEEAELSADQTPPLYALVLAPTRELAAQVKNHIDKVARHTGIKVRLVLDHPIFNILSYSATFISC